MQKDFPQQGQQTKLTPKIKEIASNISGEGLEYILNALAWIHDNIKWQDKLPNKNNYFRKRTAEQIINDGFAAGCTDMTLVFIVLARVKGISTKYIEAIDKDWLKTKDKQIKGHVYAECLINNNWVKVDPTMATINAKSVKPNLVIFGEGLDSWDLGIKNVDDLKKKFLEFAGKDGAACEEMG